MLLTCINQIYLYMCQDVTSAKSVVTRSADGYHMSVTIVCEDFFFYQFFTW